jgi:DNA-binding CsgD family transcriptional regulator
MSVTHSVASHPVGLLERDESLGALQGALAEAVTGTGHMVIVGGDAGVGKTALARALADAAGTPRRVLWGACDPLSTPRPLGPFVDLAVACGGALQEVIARPCSPHEVFAALREELTGEPAVVIVEDAHWADQATLDVLRLLGRRIRSLPVLAIVTYREEPNAGVDALRVALGDLSSAAGVSRLTLAPLSREAVHTLAAGSGIDADELYRRTSGNPFYVTEVIGTGDTSVPATVRDAVLARVAHLGTGSHEAFEVVASLPPAAESWLLDAVCGEGSAETIAAGLSAGMLVSSGHAIAFRHEIAREAVERWIAPQRRQGLHRSILAALEAATGQDPARLAHHAEQAGDDDAVVRYAEAAAGLAAAVGAHRQAAAQYGRALRAAGGLPATRRAALHELRAEALYAADDQVGSIADLYEAIAVYRREGDVGGEAGATCRLVPRLACRGLTDEAREAASTAVALLAATPERPEYAGALAALAHFHLYEDDLDAATTVARLAIHVATPLGDMESAVNAAVSAGFAEVLRDLPGGMRSLETALATARAEGVDSQVPRALNALAYGTLAHHEHSLAERWIEEGLAYTDGHDLDLWRLSILTYRMWLEVHRGCWDDATKTAGDLIGDLHDSPAPRAEAHLVLAVVRARRGDPGAAAALAEAAKVANAEATWSTRLASVAAEIDWLAGRASRIGPATEDAYPATNRQSTIGPRAEFALWRHRAGLGVDSGWPLPDPIALEIAGRHREAAGAWDALGCPYEAAFALSLADDPIDIADGHERLRGMGARPAATAAGRRLRERGIRGIPRGPHQSTRQNPASLTARELDVLALLAEGLTNGEIAQRLFVSTRTVDHHVSAILRKLDVPTRARAIAASASTDFAPRVS